jgi:hypothetical protein
MTETFDISKLTICAFAAIFFPYIERMTWTFDTSKLTVCPFAAIFSPSLTRMTGTFDISKWTVCAFAAIFSPYLKRMTKTFDISKLTVCAMRICRTIYHTLQEWLGIWHFWTGSRPHVVKYRPMTKHFQANLPLPLICASKCAFAARDFHTLQEWLGHLTFLNWQPTSCCWISGGWDSWVQPLS